MNGRLAAFLLIPIIFIWAIWGEFSVSISQFFVGRTIENITDAGAWGDSFGPLTSIFSIIGTLLVVMTLFLQRVSIKDQANDLHRQRFEGSFFELLGLLRELRGELSYRFSPMFVQSTSKLISSGRKSIHRMAAILDRDSTVFDPKAIYRGRSAVTAAMIDARYYIGKLGEDNYTKEKVGLIYSNYIQTKAEPTFSPYFRLIYSILDRLRNDTVLSPEEKEGYSRLLRSQLTSHELSIIAINACAPISKDMFSLITEYRMLKYHPPSTLDGAVKIIYPEAAYSPRPETVRHIRGIREYLYP